MADLDQMRLQLRSVIAVCACILGGAASGAFGLYRIGGIVADTRNEIRLMQQSINDLRDNTMTLSRASEIALRSAIENPGQRVPDPRNPDNVIVVNPGNRTNMIPLGPSTPRS